MEPCQASAAAFLVDRVGAKFLFRGQTPDQGAGGGFDNR
jgi:hypothetical protein